MLILSFDVGIKNLAYCLIDIDNNNLQLKNWNSIDLSHKYVCSYCKEAAEYKSKEIFICDKHKKDKNYKMIRKNTKEITTKHCEKIKTKSAGKIDLIELGRNMKASFDTLFLNKKIHIVIIENQISRIAMRMKSLQGMIAQYFIDINCPDIKFVSSKNKLKLFQDKQKTSYKERKALAIKHTAELLKIHKLSQVDFFKSHSKKDDLADSFLQLLYYIINSLNLKLNDIILS